MLRRDHGSADPDDHAKANVYPYFIGVFDTVAALGNPVTSAMFGVAFVVLAAVFAAACAWVGWIGFRGGFRDDHSARRSRCWSNVCLHPFQVGV